MSTKVAVFVGTRPEIIKMAPVIRGILDDSLMELLLVHTCQHYDWAMSGAFVRELDLPEPHQFLKVGSGSHGTQTAKVMQRAERILVRRSPNLVLVEGDTNSVLGVALACAKLGIPLGHIEAGCRSFDRMMPEEVNRVIITDCASLHFAATRTCVRNLKAEGVNPKSVYLTGHPIVDLLYALRSSLAKKRARNPSERGHTALLTLHRQENVDDPARLSKIMQAVQHLDLSVLFPVHPRTHKNLRRFRIPTGKTVMLEPMGYLDTLDLIQNSRLVLTDSGGIQQEACILGTPCITLRDRTEWTETVEYGVNFLVGQTIENLPDLCSTVLSNEERIRSRFSQARKIFGKQGVTKTILSQVKRYLELTKRG